MDYLKMKYDDAIRVFSKSEIAREKALTKTRIFKLLKYMKILKNPIKLAQYGRRGRLYRYLKTLLYGWFKSLTFLLL